MDKRATVIEQLLQQKVLPLYYTESTETSIAILKTLYNAGIRILEYTNRGGEALNNFKALRKSVDDSLPGLFLGIGTIKNESQANQYINAGADFIVCPSVDVEVGKVVQKAKLPWIPGCMTPTEIAVAENAGATLVKIFPGNILGPTYITAIREIFPNLKFMVTGGVSLDADNLKSWFDAGVVAVGMGSKLISKEIVQQQDYTALENSTRKVLMTLKK